MNAIVAFPTPAEKAFADQFRALRSAAAPGSTDLAARESDYAAFTGAGLPHRRIEAWHYTDLRAILRDVLPPAQAPDAEAVGLARTALAALPAAPGGRIVLLDGRFEPSLSSLPLLADLDIGSVADHAPSTALAAAQRLGSVESVVSLNGALLQGGVVIVVGTKRAAPLDLVSIVSGAAPAATYTRSFVELAPGASARIVERHLVLRPGRSQGHHVLVMAVGDGASLNHTARIDDLGAETLHVGSMLVRLGAKAEFTSTTLMASAGVTRRQAYLEFAGPHSKAHFFGASLLDGRCHADTTLVLTHTAPNCESRELYKHVLDGEATGIYQGKVIVAPGAQKTDGKMLSKAVFLDEGATMYNKPELEIFADDVVCGHGATAGALDDNQLFYLRARGIPKAEAQAMLLEAFAEEALDGISDDDLRSELTDRISLWLRQRGL